MRIIIDIKGRNNFLSYICARCGEELGRAEENILRHPYRLNSKCEDNGAYCDRPEITFTATSRDHP